MYETWSSAGSTGVPYPWLILGMTSHAAGYARFINSNTVLANQLNKEYKYWRDGFLQMIRQSGLKYIKMPWLEQKDKKYENTATGSFVNYLKIGNMIIFPIFEIPSNFDQKQWSPSYPFSQTGSLKQLILTRSQIKLDFWIVSSGPYNNRPTET